MSEQSTPTEPEHASDSDPSSSSPPQDERSAFLGALVEAMQGPVAAEHARVVEDIERRRQDLVAAINARRAIDDNRMRDLAAVDHQAIDTWAASERLRVQFEQERRTHELEQDLVESLAQHQVKIDREIEAAEAAIVAHRADLNAFFETLRRETDPVVIAQLAHQRPVFPGSEAIAASAVAEAASGAAEPAPVAAEPVPVAAEPVPVALAPEPVGVMDPGAAAPSPVHAEPVSAISEPAPVAAMDPGATASEPTATSAPVAVMDTDPIAARRAEWWEWWKNLPEPPELAEVLDEVEQGTAAKGAWIEPVPVGAATAHEPSGSRLGSLLHSIPITRPLLHRGDNTHTQR